MEEKVRAQRNQTLTLHPEEVEGLKKLITPAAELNNDSPAENKVENKIFNGDIIETLKKLPDAFADLIIIDPPYNLTKNFNGNTFIFLILKLS